MLTEQVFREKVQWIKDNYPDLKVRVYKGTLTPGRVSGEYMEGHLSIAIGPDIITGKQNWEWSIGTLAHEFSHYLRERRHSDTYNKRLYEMCGQLYSKRSTDEERKSALYWVLHDEYYTDCDTWDVVLKRWGLQDEFPDWFYWANNYNYKIKYLYETGLLVSDREGYIKAPNSRFDREQIHRPLTVAKKREITSLVKEGAIPCVYENYEDKVEDVWKQKD